MPTRTAEILPTQRADGGKASLAPNRAIRLSSGMSNNRRRFRCRCRCPRTTHCPVDLKGFFPPKCLLSHSSTFSCGIICVFPWSRAVLEELRYLYLVQSLLLGTLPLQLFLGKVQCRQCKEENKNQNSRVKVDAQGKIRCPQCRLMFVASLATR
jgi:hypothetical protein